MPYFGKIKHYDSWRGTGAILPSQGGEPLPFGKDDLLREGKRPLVDEEYSFETFEVNGQNKRATNLKRLSHDQILEQQARAQRG